MGALAKKPISIDEVEDKEKFPQNFPGSQRPTWTPALQRCYPLGNSIEKVPVYVYKDLVQ